MYTILLLFRYPILFAISLVITVVFGLRYTLYGNPTFNLVPLGFGVAGLLYGGFCTFALSWLHAKLQAKRDPTKTRLVCDENDVRVVAKAIAIVVFVIISRKGGSDDGLWKVCATAVILGTSILLLMALIPAKKNWVPFEELVDRVFSRLKHCPLCGGRVVTELCGDWKLPTIEDPRCTSCQAKFHPSKFLFQQGFAIEQPNDRLKQ